MATENPGEVTRLLQEIEAGNEQAKEALFARIRDEIHQVAENLMRKERPDHTLQPTALVHEAIIRLIGDNIFAKAKSRAYFFGAVVRAMRQILREHARKRNASTGPGRWKRTPFDDILDTYAAQNVDLGGLEETLEKLAELHPRQHEVVTLRFYGGWRMREIADMLEVSLWTVEGDFRAARAFLRGQLGEGQTP